MSTVLAAHILSQMVWFETGCMVCDKVVYMVNGVICDEVVYMVNGLICGEVV